MENLFLLLALFSLLAAAVVGYLHKRRLHGSRVTKSAPAPGQFVQADLEHSIVSFVEGKGFSSLLKRVNEIVGSRLAILAFFEAGLMVDVSFFGSDSHQIVSLPNPDTLKDNPDQAALQLMEKLKDQPILYFNGPYHSMYGGVEGTNALVFGFSRRNEVYAVLQFIHREKPFRASENEVFLKLWKAVHPVALNYYLEHQELEQRRAAEMALRKSEERYRSIFNDSMDLIYHTDPEGRILAINPAGVEMLGYASEEELVGKKLHDFFSKNDQRSFYFDLITRQGRITDMEIILINRKGKKILCLESASAAFYGDGKVKSFTGIIKNISERVELNRQLMQANIELTEINTKLNETQNQMIHSEKMASIGQLSAGLAHEINNPLGFVHSNFSVLKRYSESLLGFSDAVIRHLSTGDELEAVDELKRTYRIDRIREDLGAVFTETEEGLERMMEIVKNLGIFSREESSKALSLLDINEAIKNSLVLARNEIKYHASVSTNLQSLPPVQCRQGEIKQVILNLLVNAAQAIKEDSSPDKKGRILVSSFMENGFICFSIEDSGPGIPQEMQSRIFDPFFTTKEVGSGTGLGLSISYDIIVQKHKGDIRVGTSTLGGAKFTVMLPEEWMETRDEAEALEELS